MSKNSKEIKRLIVEKNLMLSSFNQNYSIDSEQAHQVRAELDSLLYQYCKMLRCM